MAPGKGGKHMMTYDTEEFTERVYKGHRQVVDKEQAVDEIQSCAAAGVCWFGRPRRGSLHASWCHFQISFALAPIAQ